MPNILFNNGAGWGTFQSIDTNGHVFSMPFSYMTNVPKDILEAAIHTLKTKEPFEVHFDAEHRGEWSIISYGAHTIVTVESNTRCGYTKTSLKQDRDTLIQILIRDIETDLDKWAEFSEPEDWDAEKQELQQLIERFTSLRK